MKNKVTLVVLFSACFITYNSCIGSFCGCSSSEINQDTINRKEIENYLTTARIVTVEKELDMGRTDFWRVTLDDGKISLQGFFKHINRPRPSLLPDSYKYEIAAYELDKLLDINIVPPVVEREIEGIKGSLQLAIDNFMDENHRKRKNVEPPDFQKFNNTLEEIKIFEILVNDECRDIKDILIQKKDWKIWRVDFSEAFFPSPELPTACRINRCSKKLYQNLQRLKGDDVRARLLPYLSEEEIKALLTRKNLIVKKIKELIEKKGKELILFSSL